MSLNKNYLTKVKMETTSHVQRATFTFKDPFNYKSSNKCETSITVNDTISNNTPVYIIDYRHTIITRDEKFVIDDTSNVIRPCPFAYHSEDIKDSYNGVIIIKNEMTTSMVKFLMMENAELSNYIGSSDPFAYRNKIMVHITHFWD